jgi:hypothetical protein
MKQQFKQHLISVIPVVVQVMLSLMDSFIPVVKVVQQHKPVAVQRPVVLVLVVMHHLL